MIIDSSKIEILNNVRPEKDKELQIKAIENQNAEYASYQKKNRLTNIQFYKVCETLKSFEERIKKEELNRTQAASAITEAVGFLVTKSSVDAACKIVSPGLFNNRDKEQIGNCSVISRLKLLSKGLLELYRKLGEDVPSYLFEEEWK